MKIATCHPEAPHWGKGLCKPCYQRTWASQPHIKRRHSIKNKEYRTANPEKRRETLRILPLDENTRTSDSAHKRLRAMLSNAVVAGNGCLEWQGARDRYGYGQVAWRHNKRGYKGVAHRLVWILNNGLLGPTQFVCHRCDNPPCINLEHLFVGSQTDNMQDMSAKGRAGLSKLTVEDVIRMRDRARNGERVTSIARDSAVQFYAAYMAIRGHTFASVPGAVPAKRRRVSK